MSKISKNLKQFRTEQNLTQDEIAEKIHVSRQAVSSWETGRTQPGIDMLESLSELFGVSIEELIYGKKNKVSNEAPDTSKRKQTILITALAVFGTLLTTVGAVIVFLRFWQELKIAKNIAAFLPFAAGCGIGIFALLKRRDKLPWIEAGSLAWAVGIFSTNALLNSINAIDMGFENLLLLDTLLLIPIILLTNAVIPYVAFFPALLWSGGIIISNLRSTAYIVIGILMLALLTLAAFWYKKHEKDGLRAKVRFAALLIAFFAYNIEMLAFGNSLYSDYIDMTTMLAPFAGMLVLFAFSNRFADDFFRKACEYLVLPCGIICAATASGNFRDFRTAPVIVAAVSLAEVVLALTVNRKNISKNIFDLLTQLHGILLMLVIILFIAVSEIRYKNYDEIAHLIVIFISAAGGVIYMVKGIKTESLLCTNLGLLTVAVDVFLIMLYSIIDEFAIGLVCLILGAGILAFNAFLSKKFKKGKTKALPVDAEDGEAVS